MAGGYAGGMSEKQLQDAVAGFAFVCGWRRYHTFDSRRSEPGFPDLVLVRAGRLVAAELKAAAGRVTASQQAWLDDLALVPGVEVFVWRPDDWTSGRVEAVLRR